MKTVTERFLTYVKHHTTSDEASDTFPSTKRQLAFAAFLAKECEAIGLQSVSVDAYGRSMKSAESKYDWIVVFFYVCFLGVTAC